MHRVFFFYIISQQTRSSKKNINEKWNVFFYFCYNNCFLKCFSFYEGFRELLWCVGHICLDVKYPLLLPNFNPSWIFSTDFRTILKYQISWKFIQWEPSCSMRTDRQPMVALPNHGNASRKSVSVDRSYCTGPFGKRNYYDVLTSVVCPLFITN
jgi:hypothetical protein